MSAFFSFESKTYVVSNLQCMEEHLCSQFAGVLCSYGEGFIITNLNNIIDIITVGKVNLAFDQIAIFLVTSIISQSISRTSLFSINKGFVVVVVFTLRTM